MILWDETLAVSTLIPNTYDKYVQRVAVFYQETKIITG
jgi:hypothetical protein